MTAGGGSIPFEAGRLGFRTIANELNPVACLILRATCQWPQQHGYALLDDYRECATKFLTRVNELLADAYPDEPAPDCANGECPHPQRMCSRNGCDHKTENCSQSVHARAASRAQRYAQTYLWAREAQCPSCHVQIPLSPNWRLDDKGTGMRLETHGAKIELSIVHDRSACSDCKATSKNCHLSALVPRPRRSAKAPLPEPSPPVPPAAAPRPRATLRKRHKPDEWVTASTASFTGTAGTT